jgi:hypothetical protein
VLKKEITSGYEVRITDGTPDDVDLSLQNWLDYVGDHNGQRNDLDSRNEENHKLIQRTEEVREPGIDPVEHIARKTRKGVQLGLEELGPNT